MQTQKLARAILLVIVLLQTIDIAAQNGASPPKRSPLDGTSWGVVYDVPGTKEVKLTPNVPYLSDEKGSLAIDIYSPPDLKAGEKRAAVVFMNAIGDSPAGKVKNWEIYRSWPRLVAAHGLIGISMEADGSRIQESVRSVFEFLANKGAEYGIDGTRLGLYAASANVTNTTEYLGSNEASKNIRAAVLYYGGVPSGNLRTDLPVMFIVAQSDAPRMGQQLTSLWQRVVETKAPWTLLYARGLPHAFDAFSDNDEARRIVQQSISFWKSNLEPVPQPPWEKSPAREIVAAGYGNENQRAVELLTAWIKENPNDVQAYQLMGGTLQRLARYDEASAAYEKAQALGAEPNGIYTSMAQVRAGQRRFDEAVQLYQRAINGGVQNPFVYSQLAYVQLQMGKAEDAIQSYEKAFALGIPPGNRGAAYYNLACGYAKLGQKEKALDALSKAVDAGFTNRTFYETDKDFEVLRSEARFKEILDRLPKS
jgi:Flp pilus assembly protein TadD